MENLTLEIFSHLYTRGVRGLARDGRSDALQAHAHLLSRHVPALKGAQALQDGYQAEVGGRLEALAVNGAADMVSEVLDVAWQALPLQYDG